MNLLSIVIPVFNERASVCRVVDRVRASEVRGLAKEIIVVDDGSTDGTREVLKAQVGKTADLRLLFHERNRGKGAALHTGIAETHGEIVLVQDADFEYDPAEYAKLVQPIRDGAADVVYGSRFLGDSLKDTLRSRHRLQNKALTVLSNLSTGLRLTDMETCYKVFSGDLIRSLRIEEQRFGFEPEITAKIAKLNARILEVRISYRGRSRMEGKKITWKDGVSALRCIVKYR